MKKTPTNISVHGRSKTSTHRRDGVVLLEEPIARDRSLRELVDEATLNAVVAQLICQARTEAGLTQARLAKIIGTRQSVVSRLEVRFVDPSNRAA
jgi:ribosome-binding protein aMBF1 (putative translation factor)